jgi:hypothetical protein
MMRAALALVLLILSSLFSFANAEAIAQVVALYGAPTASGRALSAGSAINEHDKISVGSGNVQILFNDGTKLVLGSGSTLIIEKYLMKGGNTASNVSIDALRGTFRFITGNSAKKAYHIRTANSTIGIRGTGFDFWVNQDTGVVVLQGKVKLGRGGSSVNINAGCQAGIAQSDKTQLLKPSAQSNLIRVHLPFILSQSFLRPAFRLNVASCANILSLTEPTQGQGHSCQQSCTQSCSYQTAGQGNCTTTCSCQ